MMGDLTDWLDNLTGGMKWGPPAEEDVLAMAAALSAVLDNHTRIITDQHVDGPTAVCEQCSEDRMFAIWPCKTIEDIQTAIGDA